MDDEDELEIYANPNHHLDVADSTKAITLVSFGYKHGAPGDTIHNFNIQQKVANPPNSLRKNRTGLDKELQLNLFQDPLVKEVCNWLATEIVDLINKNELNENIRIGIGCHSGKHRSVAIVEWLVGDGGWQATVSSVMVVAEHRDLGIAKKQGGGHKANARANHTRARDKKYSHDNS